MAVSIKTPLTRVEDDFLALCKRPLVELEKMPYLRDDLFALIRRRRAIRGLVVREETMRESWWA
ncbi:MAG: hypothetical protein AB1760_00040 [Pseudomonadota bacterium]